MTVYTKSMMESLAEVRNLQEDNMDLMRKAAGGSMQTIKMKDGKLKMDSFTASAMMQVYDKVNDKNKKAMEGIINSGKRAQMVKLQSIAMKAIKSENDPEIEEEVELDEAKYDLYHKDFSSAMQHAYKMAKKLHGITVKSSEIDDKVASGPKKPSEGKTNSYRLEGDKGAIQVQVYNKGGSKPYELNFYKEEVELDEGTAQVLAHGGKGQFKVVRNKEGVIDVMYKGKVISSGDYDRGAGSFFMNITGEKGQKSFNKPQDIADYFAKNKITEKTDLDEGTWALPKTSKQKAALKKLLSKPLPAKDAVDKLYDLIGDDELADNIDDFEKDMGPKADVRNLVRDRMKELGIKEEVEPDSGLIKPFYNLDEGKMKELHGYIEDGKSAEWIAKKMGVDVKTIKALMKESIKEYWEIGTDEYRKHTQEITPGEVDEASAGADAKRAMKSDPSMKQDPFAKDVEASDDDVKGAEKNIIMQLRGLISLRGIGKVQLTPQQKRNLKKKDSKYLKTLGSGFVQFEKGQEKVDIKVAQAVLNKFNSIQKPVDKMKFQTQISKSYKDMLKSLKEEVETILERIDRKLKERKNG